jgi:hypothetical protein
VKEITGMLLQMSSNSPEIYSSSDVIATQESAICGLQRIKENILVRFEPTNLRIVYLKNDLRKLKYVYLNSWVRQ